MIRNPLILWLVVGNLGFISCSKPTSKLRSDSPKSTGDIHFHSPLGYPCRYVDTPINCDGRINDAGWALAEWSEEFGDIEGPIKESPPYTTRFKMLWDDTHLHIAAEIEEEDLWATYDQRDMIVFHENDFEVFLDPDGDGRNYFEIEVNVLGTVFDLFLYRTYREGGPADHEWNASGMIVGIDVNGSINDPSDRDQSWALELSIPWTDFVPPTGESALRRLPIIPKPGEVWRVNFSRVQWDLEITNGKYEKIERRREHNWTWTPQWEINMHEPRYWGYLEFMDRNE